MVKKHAAVRRASSFAKECNEKQKPKSATEFVKFSRAVIEFQILALQSELQMLDELSKMSDEEKLSALFEMLDRDGDGKLSAVELAGGLQKIRGDVNFEESLALAIARVAAFDTNEDGMLNEEEFESLLTELLPLIGCTFHEVSEMLIMKVIFSDTGSTPLEDAVADFISEEVTEEVKVDEGLRHAMKDRRMKALFQVFDEDGDGSVDFKEVVVGMYKLTDGVDEASRAAVTALLLFDEKQTRELSYKDFARLMLNVVASSPDHVTFDDVADTLTRNASSTASEVVTSEHVAQMFSMDTTSKLLLDISDNEEYVCLGVVEMAKMDRLFGMFDIDNDGRIGADELTSGLRKFHDTTRMQTTVAESTQVMNAFDKDADGQLDKQEFASFIVNFANTADIDIVDMLDFMIVVSALKENNEAEQDYMDSIGGEGEIDYWYG